MPLTRLRDEADGHPARWQRALPDDAARSAGFGGAGLTWSWRSTTCSRYRAGTVARGGPLFVRYMSGGEEEPDGPEQPWPVRGSEPAGFTVAGLDQVDLTDRSSVPAAFPFVRVIYQRTA